MSRLSSNVDAAGCPGRLSAIRLRHAPGSTARAFGRVVGDLRWRSWEGEGHVPGEARLAAALSKLPGVDGLALARWAREGGGEMPSGVSAGSARPPVSVSAYLRKLVKDAAAGQLEPELAARMIEHLFSVPRVAVAGRPGEISLKHAAHAMARAGGVRPAA